MSKYEEADLILKLYDLRREETMRQARVWYIREFDPQSMEDVRRTVFGEHSGHFRMVVTYWDMAAALVNSGAISADLFEQVCGEMFVVYSMIEHLLGDIRGTLGPQFGANIEKLVESLPDGRQRVAATRERIQAVRASLAERAKTAQA